MGAAAYNRGSRVISREADENMSSVIARANGQAHRDEAARLRVEVARLERDLARVRRCLAAERNGREQLRLRLARSERDYEFSVSILCRRAFPPPDGQDVAGGAR